MNSKVINMISCIDADTIDVLNAVKSRTIETGDIDDVDLLDILYEAGWIAGYRSPSNDDECLWVLTNDGLKLLEILDDIIL